jgi:hypothetical protein
MQVAILGAPQTGKTQLTHALKAHLIDLGLRLEVLDAAPPESLSPEDLVLLCGLDLTPASAHQQATDSALRASLMAENALFCLGRQLPHVAHSMKRSEIPAKWQGACETCGDGDCEHRLFTGLVQR